MQIFVGNLSFASTQEDIKKLFEKFGSVDKVTLLMDKNGRKSRGFGFVDMSDEQSALAAISALDTREFMGRPLNVMVARPRTIKEPVVEEKRRPRFRPEAKTRHAPRREIFKEEVRFKPKPVAERPSRFKGGRRSSSYLRRTLGRSDEQFREHSKPWQRSEGQDKPWRKTEGRSKPWEKSERSAKPRERSEGHAKSWEKSEERAKPWQRREGRSMPWKKAEVSAKPWKRSEGSSSASRSRFKNRSKNRKQS
jgi:RNA recognition motif-containing protein